MKLNTRILSACLTVLMLLGSVSALSVNASATETKATKPDIEDYWKTVYNTPEEKLATMEVMLEEDGCQLYVDDQSGEVALYNTATGETLFSNPYDVGSSVGSESTKGQILSQIFIQYTDNGTTKYLYSYTEAALRNQINAFKIKNGVRVEYSIGREESRKLVPRQILKESFETNIMAPMKEALERGDISQYYYDRFMSFYTLQDPNKSSLATRARQSIINTYPICGEQYVNDAGKLVYNAIYTFAADATSNDLNWVEDYIKAYCDEYTFEQMDIDHEEAQYEATDEQYPLFKLALEYTIDDGNLIATLPCNGLRYDMTTYTLEYISVLPYMGAGNSTNAGYNFYPDGSGSLFDYEELNTKSTTTIRGKIYGVDYAYHEITGATYQKTIRYPVYGSVSTEKIYQYSYTTPKDGKTYNVSVSDTVKSAEKITAEIDKAGGILTSGDLEETAKVYQRGYLAVIEAGESLGEISTYHAGALSDYNTMITYFNPKPKDSYDLADSISVTSSSTWTVVSDRKYTGKITIRYMMLGDDTLNGDLTHYECSWLGMADAYRDYLVNNGSLTSLTEYDIEEDYIPLYIETFGAMETQQTIATIPVDVMTPFTTFEDVYTMYEELSAEGVKNINFKLTGYANGGMYNTVPYALKWESAVGGQSGFEELVEKSNEVNEKGDGSQLGIYPDFDFAYIQETALFDGITLKNDAIKTIDNRYTSLRQYSATQQMYVSYYQLAISPARYERLYEKLMKSYVKYDLDTISVSSLGNALNSNFDEDYPANREDNKEYTMEALEGIYYGGQYGKLYTMMSEDCNAYAVRYMSHMLDVSLDSSRYVKSSASVPFVGAVLHGCVQFAGTAYNEEGDSSYAMLRAIENGASLYFILSYQNTSYLKEDEYFSQYYSVRYDIWKDDVVEAYNELNSLLSDVQTKTIVDHEFLVGERVLDLEELEADIAEKLQEAKEAEEAKQEQERLDKILTVANAWTESMNAESYMKSLVEKMQELNKTLLSDYEAFEYAVDYMYDGDYISPPASTYWSSAVCDFEDEEGMNIPKALSNAVTALRNALQDVLTDYMTLQEYYAEIEERYQSIDDAIATVQASDMDADVIQNMVNTINELRSKLEAPYLEAKEQLELNAIYVADEGEESVWQKIAVVLQDAIGISTESFLTAEKAGGLVCSYENLDRTKFNLAFVDTESLVEYYDMYLATVTDNLFSKKEIITNLSMKASDETKTETDDDTNDRYVVDNNKIVAVTYGTRNIATNDKTPYKTFLLNYNNYSVRVEYEGSVYTIESGGYIVIYR